MLSVRSLNIRIFFAVMLLALPEVIYSQVNENGQMAIDTSDYVPFYTEGAIDYNLMIAASKGYVNEVNRLIMEGADIFAETGQQVTPLIFAVSNNMTKVAKILIDYGSDVNKITLKGETPLIIAVKNENYEIAEALIRAGAEIDLADRYKATPLHYASAYGYFKMVDLLLYYEALIDMKTEDGTTPLLASIWAGNDDVSDLLIQNGADIRIRDNEGFSPYLMSALAGDTIIMKLLLTKGADMYEINNAKQNALDLTIMADHNEAAKFLLKTGNKWAEQGNVAISPYSVAAKYRRKEILKTLGEYNIPGNINYQIDQVDIMLSTRFFVHDIYTGVSFSFKEPFLNGGIIVGLDTKLWYTRVLIKQSEHAYYQYMNKGSVFYTGVFKDFTLTDNAFRGNFELSTSLSGAYSFGNELKGTLNIPSSKFRIIPAASIKWSKKDLSFSLGADYIKTDFYHVGPVWLRFGVSYNLYFDNVRTNPKTLKWY
jgi:ankyrin repeat protein